MVKILIVATSSSKMGDKDTGYWVEEVAAPYYKFLEAGHEVVIASPAGGPIPVDQGSVTGDFFTLASQKFVKDEAAQQLVNNTIKIADVDVSEFAALYAAGGHGACVDFVGNPALSERISAMYTAGKVVSTCCHGCIALVDPVVDGKPLVAGKKVAGFTDKEETMIQLDKVVPFLVQSKLVELGANFDEADPWAPHAVADGNLITGQNPGSSDATADLIIKALA